MNLKKTDMKTIITSIIISVLIFNLNAQTEYNYTFEVATDLEDNSSIKLEKDLLISSGFKVLIAPQFGSLFNESFKYVIGIKNLINYYDKYDLGIKLGFTCEIIKRLKFNTSYNVGMLKFNFSQGNIQDSVMKLSLNYNF